jgi:hypothetical protein
MRRRIVVGLALLAATVSGCGAKFELPTEHPGASVIPSDKSYAMLQTWKSLDHVLDILVTQGTGSQLFLLKNWGGDGGPTIPRGEVQLYPFSRPVPIGPPFFESPLTLFNPVALAHAQNRLFVLDEGDSCKAKYDIVLGNCRPDTVRNGRPNIVRDYSAVWRVREYKSVGGDTISTFTDTTFSYVRGIAADDAGFVYVSGMAVVLDTSATDTHIRTRKLVSRIYRYARGPRYPGIVPGDVYMPGADWHRDTTWVVLDGSGASSVSDPRRIAWSPLASGVLFVADRGNNKAKLIGTSANGIGLTRVDGSETPTGTSFNEPEGVAMDSQGFLYVVDRLNQRVLRYDIHGVYIQDVNVENNDDKLPLLDPVAVGVDDSLAYVVDVGRGQVIRYKRRP